MLSLLKPERYNVDFLSYKILQLGIYIFFQCMLNIIKKCLHRISSSSSCRAASTDIPDPLSPLLPITHRLRQVFKVTSCVLT